MSHPFKVYNRKSDAVMAKFATFEEAVTEARRLHGLTSEHHGVFHVADCGSTETFSEDV